VTEPPGRPTRRAADHLTQHVEVWFDGAWHTAVLIGCRLQADSSAQAHVRCMINGERRSIWSSFGCLRMPLPDFPWEAAATPAAPLHAAGRHRAVSPVMPVSAGPVRDVEQVTTRLPLARVAVPPPGGQQCRHKRAT
jgi:hypothetical protein